MASTCTPPPLLSGKTGGLDAVPEPWATTAREPRIASARIEERIRMRFDKPGKKSDRTETEPVHLHRGWPGSHEEDRVRHIRGPEHGGPGRKSGTVVGIERVPDSGIGRPRRDQGELHAAAAIFGDQRFVQAAQAVFARGIRGV